MSYNKKNEIFVFVSLKHLVKSISRRFKKWIKRKHLFLIYCSLLNSKIQTVCHSDPACPPRFSLKIRPNYVDYFSKRRGLVGEILGHLVAKASWLNYCTTAYYTPTMHPCTVYTLRKSANFSPFLDDFSHDLLSLSIFSLVFLFLTIIQKKK